MALVFFGSHESEQFRNVEKFAKAYDDVPVAVVFKPDLFSKYNVERNENKLFLFKHFDELMNTFDGVWGIEQIE